MRQPNGPRLRARRGGALREVSMDGSRVGNEAVEMLYVFSARHKLGFHLPLQVGWGA